jgi:hypothetical protein
LYKSQHSSVCNILKHPLTSSTSTNVLLSIIIHYIWFLATLYTYSRGNEGRDGGRQAGSRKEGMKQEGRTSSTEYWNECGTPQLRKC